MTSAAALPFSLMTSASAWAILVCRRAFASATCAQIGQALGEADNTITASSSWLPCGASALPAELASVRAYQDCCFGLRLGNDVGLFPQDLGPQIFIGFQLQLFALFLELFELCLPLDTRGIYSTL